MIDYWALTGDYKVGQTVQRFVPGLGGLSLSPFLGRVTSVHKGLGVVDVQWPYGNERMYPDDIVRVDPKLSVYLPPTLDQSYSTYDTRKQATRIPGLWRTTEVPPQFHRELAQLWTRRASDVHAYDELWQKYSSTIDDETLRSEVKRFYQVASGLSELRVQQFLRKTAAYWVAQNRQYRVTSEEFAAKKPACPKCGTKMKRTTYKMDKGARVRLFACPKDLFLLKQTDLLGPGGEPLEW